MIISRLSNVTDESIRMALPYKYNVGTSPSSERVVGRHPPVSSEISLFSVFDCAKTKHKLNNNIRSDKVLSYSEFCPKVKNLQITYKKIISQKFHKCFTGVLREGKCSINVVQKVFTTL